MNIFGDLSARPRLVLVAPVKRIHGAGHDFTIMTLWKFGNDTVAIADRLKLKESFVANRLAALRDEAARS